MNQDFRCILMLQRGVFEDREKNTIMNASLPQLSMEEEVSWCGEPFQLLVLVSCFTVTSQLMLWNTGAYCIKACFPQLKSCFLKRNNQMLFFNKTMLLPTLQRPPKQKLTGKHFSMTQLFEAINIEWNNTDSSFCKKLSTRLPTRLKHLKKSKGNAIEFFLN